MSVTGNKPGLTGNLLLMKEIENQIQRLPELGK
jgi:hypothetical protein